MAHSKKKKKKVAEGGTVALELKPIPASDFTVVNIPCKNCNCSFREDLLCRLIKHNLDFIVINILSMLDCVSLNAAEKVSREWNNIIAEGQIWKRLLEKNIRSDSQWEEVAKLIGISKHRETPCNKKKKSFHRFCYYYIMKRVEILQQNWSKDKRIAKCFEIEEVACCLQFNHKVIALGMEDGKINVFSSEDPILQKKLIGHSDAVLCIQLDGTVVYSGSSDCTIRVWEVKTGKLLNVLNQHSRGILDLKLENNVMVSSSLDSSLGIWDVFSHEEIRLRRQIKDIVSEILCITFDTQYLITGCIDGSIKIWDMSLILNSRYSGSFTPIKSLTGHTECISCLHYSNKFLASGSADSTVRLWNIEGENCFKSIREEDGGVLATYFNNERLVYIMDTGLVNVVSMGTDDKESTTLARYYPTSSNASCVCAQANEFAIMVGCVDRYINIWEYSSFPLLPPNMMKLLYFNIFCTLIFATIVSFLSILLYRILKGLFLD